MQLTGYKTKITIAATFAYAIGGLILGNLDANTALTLILAACGGYGIYDKLDRTKDEFTGKKNQKYDR